MYIYYSTGTVLGTGNIKITYSSDPRRVYNPCRTWKEVTSIEYTGTNATVNVYRLLLWEHRRAI